VSNIGEPDSRYMEQALQLAQRAIGRTSPNPPVGAVVVRDGTVVGKGWTQPPGGAHAEVVALREAGPAAQGADLYVTLEPCTFWGRTPPCTDAIKRAGVRRVFWAAQDPDPRMGQGAAAMLAKDGIEGSQLAGFAVRAEEQMEGFLYWKTRGRPLVISKYAMTLDGKIATKTGDSRWITGPAARRRVHELRDQVDAILVGVGTVLADDPQLTTRIENHWRPVHHPLRIVVDSRGRTPLSAQVLDPDLPGHTIIATVQPDNGWCSEVQARGVEVMMLPADDNGYVDLRCLLQALGERGITTVLVEGGAQVLGSLASEQLIARIWAFVAPKLIGGSIAPGPVGDPGIAHLADAQPWYVQQYEMIGDDVLIIAAPIREKQSIGA
jgi:diaminohydroxyphosphoribosylaminopyrimidine deaminase/5-amino-6-(5-phosphoribosylamino)uracil reductase